MSRNEIWKSQFKEAARHHGGECVGLAIGIRAVDIALRELGPLADPSKLEVKVGTKKCLGDAFKILLRLQDEQLEYMTRRNDMIVVRRGDEAIELHLTPKKIDGVSKVFDESEESLFPTIRKTTANPAKG